MEPTSRARDPEEVGRHAGSPLDPEFLGALTVDGAAVARRVAEVEGGGVTAPDRRASLLLGAVSVVDLTTLDPDDTPARVRRLCARARRPVDPVVLRRLGLGGGDVRVAAVCVAVRLVPVAAEALGGSGIPVAAAAGDFPAGKAPLEDRVAEIKAAVASGAEEIDAVIDRRLVARSAWETLYEETRAYREAAGDARLKTIVESGELDSLEAVARAAHVCMMAGADFVKTSTGKASVGATLPAGVVMLRAIRIHRERTGHRVGFKPAGGIRTAGQAMAWQRLVERELGAAWLRPWLFRIGASSLLDALEEELRVLAARGARSGPPPPPA